MTTEIDLGEFVVGEKPNALQYQFLDASNVPINLTGYTAVIVIKEYDGVAVSHAATVATPLSGIVTYTWAGTEMPTAGSYQAQFWVGNTAQRYGSWFIKWRARLSLGPVPAI